MIIQNVAVDIGNFPLFKLWLISMKFIQNYSENINF